MEDFITLWSFGFVAWIVGTLIVAFVGAWLTWRGWRPEHAARIGHVPPLPIPAAGTVTTDTYRVHLGDPRSQMSETK